ncbi:MULTISPECIES: hypothetical protein [unclassified Psychrobacillus]|uniref:hypothetical protein n=1 Tax=unclassified Psychrobacillus TaxID=2636677 RepID=UPI0030F9EDFA
MNALQGMMKLEKLRDEVSALEEAIRVMESNKSDSHFIRIVSEIKTYKSGYQKELEDTLKKIELPKQFY